MGTLRANMSMSYDGKVALITGAGAGLGRLYAHTFAKRGAKVVVNDMNKEAADAVVAELKALGAEAGADYNSCVDGDKVVATAIALFGTVHIIVNNAGVLRDVSFARMSDEQWEIVIKTHLYGTFSVCKAAWERCVSKNTDGLSTSPLSTDYTASVDRQTTLRPKAASSDSLRLLLRRVSRRILKSMSWLLVLALQ